MRLVRGELLKVVTARRTALGILLADLGIVLLGTVVTVNSAANSLLLPKELERDLIGVAGTSLLFATLLGVLIATTEYRHGTITLTFLATPVRERVLAAKAATAVIGSVLLVLPSLLLAVGIGFAWVGGTPGFHFGAHEFELMARLLLGAAMVATLGLFIGATLTRQLGAIIAALGWLFFAEPALAALLPATNDYLAGPSLGGVLGDTGDDDIPSFGRALPTLSAYVVGLAAIAAYFTRRRDIT